MQDMTPKEIVVELDKYIIGQNDAKRAVAVAIRNRWRRRKLDEELAREVYPKNIIMIGPTGVGKTEIARRLAKLTGAPFIKIEASKFTEVGYHGRDVESMIRDLLDQAINMVRAEMAEQVRVKATDAANERVVDLLLPGFNNDVKGNSGYVPVEQSEERRQHTRSRLLEQVKAMHEACLQAESTIKKLSDKKKDQLKVPDLDQDALEALEKALTKDQA